MKILFTIISVLITDLAFAQHFQNDSIVNKFINGLLSNKVDTILIYENGCIDCSPWVALFKDDSCSYIGNPKIYNLFWKFKGMGYATKLSNYDCYEYDTISYDIEPIWNLYFRKMFVIKNERIKPPSYIDKKDTVFLDIDHYSYSHIMIIAKGEIVSFEINNFYFNKIIDGKYTNLNYENNCKTFRKKLQIQIEYIVKNIEDDRLIKKTAYNTRYKKLPGY